MPVLSCRPQFNRLPPESAVEDSTRIQSMMRARVPVFLLALLLLVVMLAAPSARVASAAEGGGKDEKKPPKLDVNAIPENARKVEFSTDEGTWMAIDVSPDGKTILFDLLGDIYRLPIEGGKAERLTSGPAYDYAPRYS